MKNLIIGYLMMAIFTLSCQKEDEQTFTPRQTITAVIAGKTFSASSFIVARASPVTSINGSAGSVADPESISIHIAHLQVGTFMLSESPVSYAAYNSPAGEFLATLGQVTITQLTDEWIEGVFGFTAQSVSNPSLQVHLSKGEFKMRLD